MEETILVVDDQARPQVWLKFGYDDYSEVNRLEEAASVHRLEHREEGIYVLASLSEKLARRYEKHLAPPGAGEDAGD